MLPPYEDRCKLISLETLLSRPTLSALMFTFDPITDRKDAPDLLCMFDLNVPSRTLRVPSFFSINQHRTNNG